jgi:hypothetical protein
VLLVLLRIAQGRQRVRGFARLRHENREPARLKRSLAIAELGREVDLGGQARKVLEPVFCHQSGVIGGAASRHGDPLERAKVERQRARQPDALGGHVDIMRERVADDLRLLVNFLGHEVAIVALVYECRDRRFEHGALDLAASGIKYVDAVAREHGPIAVFEIGDSVSERSERDSVGAEIHYHRRRNRSPAVNPYARR